MPLEVIALNAAAAALFEGAKSAVEKGKQLHDDYRRKNKYSEEIDDLATELYDSFERNIQEKAQEENDQRLKNIVDGWSEISQILDEESEDIDLFFEDEDDAVRKKAEVIARVYAEAENPDQELAEDLEDAVREGYRDSLRDFQKSVRNTELERDLRDEYDINVVDKLNEVINRLGSEQYELFDSTSTEKAKEEVFRQGGIEAELGFVERPEIEEVCDTDKLLVTGRKGTGKTRVLARLLEEFAEDVDEVVVALDSFQNPNDVSSLESERFDGDVLLVWDDIHGISEKDDIFRDAVSKLEKALGEDGNRLMVLATARAEGYENLPRINYWKEDRVWSDFERLEFRPLEEEQAEILEDLLEKAIDKYDVDADEEVKDQLLQKAYENDPSPFYVVTVIQNTDEELTYEQVEELPEKALEVWEENYSNLGSSEKKILQVIDLLSEISLQYHSLIVEEIYRRALEEDGFGEASETLITEHWIVNTDLDRGTPDDELTYRVHDICVEAVADSLSELEVEDISDYLLKNRVRVPQEMKQDDFYVRLHNNFALFLKDNSERLLEDAEEHYEKATDIDSERVSAAYNNYGVLLKNELDELEEAAEKFEKAIEADPEYAEAYYNYGLLLHEKLDEPEEAAEMYEKAIEHDPELAQAYYNYGNLLAEELDEPEEAKEKFNKTVDIFLQKEELRHVLVSIRGLVEVHVELDDEEAVVENCELALNILDEAPHLDTDGSERLWFESTKVVAEPNDKEVVEVYRYALRNVEKNNPNAAVRLFEKVWERRDEHDTDSQAHRASVSAGVGLAAHLEILDETDSSQDTSELLDEIDPEDLSGAQKAVYDTLHPDRETDTTSADIERSANQFESLGMDEAAFEARMFAKILKLLQD